MTANSDVCVTSLADIPLTACGKTMTANGKNLSANGKTLLVVLGPTGVGKTAYALSLAEQHKCPIINADSRQIYKDIAIGTAAPTPSELARVKHYFVHTLALDEYYSAAQFETDVLQLLDKLFLTHDTVVMTGGSMMYIDAVTKGIDDIPTIEETVREELRQRLQTEGIDVLLQELRLLDPAYYAEVDQKNPKRIVHALEVCYQTGKPYSSFRCNQKKQRPFRIRKIGLRRSREDLFARINRRVDDMMEQGFLEEARRVYPLRHLNSLNTVGYKELFRVIGGEWELPMAVERIKKNTRVYAKKQMLWFSKDPEIEWINL